MGRRMVRPTRDISPDQRFDPKTMYCWKPNEFNFRPEEARYCARMHHASLTRFALPKSTTADGLSCASQITVTRKGMSQAREQ